MMTYVFFRCLALHRGATVHALERPTKALAEKFREATGRRRAGGVTLDDLSTVEKVFEVNVRVYSLVRAEVDGDDEHDDDEQAQPVRIQAELVRRSHRKFPQTLNLNLHGSHFSYVKDLGKYSRCYACWKCSTAFVRSYDLHRHELTCDGNVKHRFPGGAYHLPRNIFERLEEEGIQANPNDRYYPYRAQQEYCAGEQKHATDANGFQSSGFWCRRRRYNT